MNVRLATAADIRAMIDLERRCETAAHWTEGQYRSAMPACEAGLTSRLVLVVDEAGNRGEQACVEIASAPEDSLVGFLIARHQGPEWELENIVVDPASRRKGLGMRLLEELLKRARAAGSESIYLEVRESNQAARHFYEKWGFDEIGRRSGYYANPREDAVLYRLILREEGSQKRNVTP